MPRFQTIYCSQCGNEFGPGDHGFSHCQDHRKSKMETVNLIFIGDEYYIKSGTMMSSIYVEETWERFDWGFVQVALRAGKTVNVRPANNEERAIAEAKFASLPADCKR